MKSRCWIAALVASLLLQLAAAQVPKNNPVVDAIRAIGIKGLSESAAPASSPTKFKPSGSRIFVSAYVAGIFEADEERKAVEPALLKLIESYEASAKGTPLANDTSAALAYSVAVLYATSKSEELPEEAFPVIVERLRAHLDTTAVRAATDRQKQEAYEWALCSANLVVVLLTQATTAEAQAKIRTMASTQLQVLITAKPEQITISGKQVAIKGTTPEQPAENNSSNLAPGFTFQAPASWSKSNQWYVMSTRLGTGVTSALVRFPGAIPASGNMGDALRRLWKVNVPAPLQNAAGSMVYRRYVGSKLFSQFIFGKGTEEGRHSDSMFSLFLIDCGSYWQPVVVAQIFQADPNVAGESMSASFSYGNSADYAETMLATFRCPTAPNQALATKESLAGDYHYGSGNVQQWENIYTGASSMTFTSSAGTLNLTANGKFTYTFSSANGAVGNTQFRSAKGAGTYSIQGDILTCIYTSYDQGDSYKRKEEKYRIAGLTVFSDGVKVAVLMDDLNKPVNNVTVANNNSWYTTKK